MATKQCTKCNQIQDVVRFDKQRSRSDGRHPWCKDCMRVYNKARYDSKPELKKKCAERNRKRYHSDPEYRQRVLDSSKSPQAKARKKAYEQTQKARDRQKQYRKKNRKRILVYNRSNAGKLCQKKYNASPKGKIAILRNAAIRRARRRDIVCTLTWEEWLKIIQDSGNACAYCKRGFGPALKAEQDHIIPISKGGSHTKENVQPVCRSCNSSKCNRDAPVTLPDDSFR